MKTYYNENNEIVTTFSSEEEKETVFNLNDTVILLSSRENLPKIEDLFKISPYF